MGDPIRMNEGPVQRGNGKGGPTTPKPPLTPKGQASARTALAEQQKDGPAVPKSREPASVVGESIDDAELDELFWRYVYPHTRTEPLANELTAVVQISGTAIKYARAVLARWGHQPAPPAEGEVAELVKRLRDWHTIPTLEERARAAELLQQQHPTPVPVSERPWEREGWCDKQGRCWCVQPLDGLPHRWWLVRPEPLSHGFVLPAHALPTPEATDD